MMGAISKPTGVSPIWGEIYTMVFPIHLFQVGIPYLCMKLFAGPVELRDPLPLQRYGLAGDSAVQVMTTRPGGKGWENPGKIMGKCGEKP